MADPIKSALTAFHGSLTWMDIDVDGHLQERMRAAIEAYERAARQPIETAPNDGTPIVGYRGENCWIVWWNSDFDEWMIAPDRTVRGLTHWRSLWEASDA